MKNKEQASELLKLIIRSQEKDKASSIDAHRRSPSPKTRDFASLDLKSKNNHHENDDNENNQEQSTGKLNPIDKDANRNVIDSKLQESDPKGIY